MIATLGWGALAGFLSTIVMDVSHGLFRKAGVTAGLEPQWMGRWFLGLPRAQLRHDDIRTAESRPGELPAALGTHYAIGVTFGILWAVIAHQLEGGAVRMLGGIVFGFATNLAPWLLMFPAMGFGFFGSRAPAERKLLLTSAINHLMYGVALGVLSLAFPL